MYVILHEISGKAAKERWLMGSAKTEEIAVVCARLRLKMELWPTGAGVQSAPVSLSGDRTAVWTEPPPRWDGVGRGQDKSYLVKPSLTKSHQNEKYFLCVQERQIVPVKRSVIRSRQNRPHEDENTNALATALKKDLPLSSVAPNVRPHDLRSNR